MLQNNKTNRPQMSQDLRRHTPSQKLLNHETHTVFLVCKANQWANLFDDLSATYLAEDNQTEKTC